MDYIDYEYEERNDVYYVVYIETCPNGLNVNSNPCWAVSPLLIVDTYIISKCEGRCK